MKKEKDPFPDRNKYLGPSEAAVACGVGSYMDPVELWEIKTLRRARPVSTPIMMRGHMMETEIVRRLEEDHGILVGERQCELRDPGEPSRDYLRGHCDGITQTYHYIGEGSPLDDPQGPGIIEIKAPGSRMAQKFDREGLTPDYIVQVQLYMYLARVQWASVFYLDYDTNMIKQIDMVRDDKFIMAALVAVDKFWNCVVADIKPDLEDEPLLHVPGPSGDGEIEYLDPDRLVADLFFHKATLVENKDLVAEHEDKVKALMVELDTQRMIVPGLGKITWKEQARRSIKGKALKEWTDALVDAIVGGRTDEVDKMCEHWCSSAELFIGHSVSRPFKAKEIE